MTNDAGADGALATAAPAGPAGANALDTVRQLVRDKTRFEPEDLQPTAEEDVLERCSIEVNYQLEARLVERKISGFFPLGAADREVDRRYDVGMEAEEDADARLQLAAAALARQLAKPETGYDAIGEGVYLRHAMRHWHLDRCGGCGGAGRITCSGCYGSGSCTCHNCHGARRVRCTDWSCSGGQKSCNSCGGTGQTSRIDYVQEPVSVSHTVYHNGESHTEYRTEYQSRPQTVYSTCYQCIGGRVTCSTCHGSSMVDCGTCYARGEVTCRDCGGGGKVNCTPCEGSGKEGVAAWIDVHAEPATALLLPDGASDELRSIAAREQVAGMATQAASVAPPRIGSSAGGGRVTASYGLQLRVVRLALACGGQHYATVAYGRALRWLTLDDIVEDLLQKDLSALGEALARTAGAGLFSASVDSLLPPLQAVAASELNAEVIESVLDGDAGRAHAEVVSARYASDLEASVLGALRQIHTGCARRTWWQGVAAQGAVALPVWLYYGKWWALAGALGVMAAIVPVHTWRLRGILSRALGGAKQGARAMALAAKGKRQRLAHAMVLAPCALALAALGYALPTYGLLQPLLITQVEPHAREASLEERSAVDAALKLHAAGQMPEARRRMEQLARDGNAAAIGPYGWMVLSNDGLAGEAGQRASLGERVLESRRWIEQGLKMDDPWAQTGRGMVLINGLDGASDKAAGLALLERAANSGNRVAAHVLGGVYQQGRSATRDYAAARKWYALAAERGYAASYYELGVLWWNGHGGSRDRAKALQYWRQGAASGDPQSAKAAARGRPEA